MVRVKRSCRRSLVQGSVLVLLISACGYPRPADVEADGMPENSKFQLLALDPDNAATGDTITLEGTFDSAVMVNFPGGSSEPATVLGKHRATVVVPESATAGALSVTTGAVTVGSLAFHRTSFPLDLQPFQGFQHQGSGGRQEATLVTGRSGATSAVIANYIYVIGGSDRSGYLGTVERARVNFDGSLGPFVTYARNLVTPRAGHTCIIIGIFVYVIGGASSLGSLDSVERAMIGPDGSLGQFDIVPGLALHAARRGSASVLLGNSLYLIGGTGNGVLDSVERSTIEVNGSLGPFAILPDVVLTTARTDHTTTVVQNTLYVIGGSSSSGVVGSVERSSIGGDGTLGAFTPVAGARLLTSRAGHTSVRFGNSLYILGGVGSSGELASIEQAMVHIDGSIDAFAPSRIGSLARARGSSVKAMQGNYLYLLGGTNTDGGYSNSIEHASLNNSGALGAFSVIPDVALIPNTANVLGTLVAGSWLYVFTAGLVERAPIRNDDSLGAFVPAPEVGLNPTLRDYSVAEIKNRVYILGGSGSNDIFGRDVNEAMISPDGSLSSLAPVSGIILINPHAGANSVVIGNKLYIVGGHAVTASVQKIVEVATIDADGSLEPFTISGSTAENGCDGCASVVIGKYLYLISGLGQSRTVQRAAINDDNSLGQFAVVREVATTVFRLQAATIVVGSYLYMIGGDGLSPVDGPHTERALINADGSLGMFMPVSANLSSRSGWNSVIFNDQMYVIGGSQGSAYTSEIVRGRLH
ncbi:MAG TPA: hypothetical protein VGD37_33240 [Kofleriaceae bacterium]